VERYLSDPVFWFLSIFAVACFFVALFFIGKSIYVEGRLEYDRRRKQLDEQEKENQRRGYRTP
jgi:hypothetical protein